MHIGKDRVYDMSIYILYTGLIGLSRSSQSVVTVQSEIAETDRYRKNIIWRKQKWLVFQVLIYQETSVWR